MFVKQFLTGGDRNFGYLAADEVAGKALVVDPSYSPEMIADVVRAKGWTVEYVFCTHGHSDHTEAADRMTGLTGKKPLLFGDTDPVTGTPIEDGAELPLGGLTVTILHTPGHTDDSMCILAGDALFTGDTLFVGKVGGTGLGDDAREEYDSLHHKLMILPDATRVYPGHNYGTSPESTVGNEKKTNPFLLQPDIDSFIDLKKNWAAYKKQHGIA